MSKKFAQDNPTSHYKKLESDYSNPDNCYTTLSNTYLNKIRLSFTSNSDEDSSFGTYLQINPSLSSPIFPPNILENERILLTRYRTGSHYLIIKTGRWCNPPKPRNTWICNKCTSGELQTLKHVLSNCSFT